MNIANIKTLAANMRNAFVERKGATIGGGKFTPEELRDGAIALAAFPDMLEALAGLMAPIAGCQKEARYEAARAAIAKATGE